MPPASADVPVPELTALALWLLDLPFDPATVSSGELFDDIVEAAAEHLMSLASCLAAGHGPPPRPALAPGVDELRRRREHHALRRSVMEGRLPTGTATLREAEIRCAQAVLELTHLRRRVRPAFVDDLGATTSLLATCARTCEAYRRTSNRLHRQLVEAEVDRAVLCGLAVRAERDLSRRLLRAGTITYPSCTSGRR